MGQVWMMVLKNELDNIMDVPNEKKNQIILKVMSMTRTWLHLDDLRQFLPQEPFKEIESRMDKVMQGCIALIPEYTQEEKDRGDMTVEKDENEIGN